MGAVRHSRPMRSGSTRLRLCTKKKMGTRTIPMHPKLWEQIDTWRSTLESEPDKTDWLFPSKRDAAKHFPRRTVDQALRVACKKLGFEGVSTHSFQRSALTAASSKGVPLRVIQSISGHSNVVEDISSSVRNLICKKGPHLSDPSVA